MENIIIVAITGASGAAYGVKILELLRSYSNVSTHLIISKASTLTIPTEIKQSILEIKKLASKSYNNQDLAAPMSSGSFKTQGMIIAPCSSKTLAAIALGYEDNLITRAAIVTLKERRRLVLMFRETPYHIVHLHNMIKVTKMGGIIAPPVPAFYNNPNTIDDIIEYSAARTLDLFGVKVAVNRWKS